MPTENPGVFGIDAAFAKLTKHLDKVLKHQLEKTMEALNSIERKVDKVPSRQEFDQAKQALGQAINDAATRVQNDIQALRDQLAAGNPITDQDLVDIQNDLGLVGAIDPAVIPPPPAP